MPMKENQQGNQIRWIEDTTEWTGLKIEAAQIIEVRRLWRNVLLSANSPGTRH